jgi:hypothetical protein
VVAILSSRDLYCREAAHLSSHLTSGDVEVAQFVQLLPLISVNEWLLSFATPVEVSTLLQGFSVEHAASHPSSNHQSATLANQIVSAAKI